MKRVSKIKHHQQGVALLEALIAILLVAFGVLGLSLAQTRMLVETRTANYRATAIRLMADLNERIKLNAGGAQPIGGNASAYQQTSWDPPADSAPSGSCDFSTAVSEATACTAAAVATYDVWLWRRAVADGLMGGISTVTQEADNRQFRVVIAWKLNEATGTTLDDAMKISFGSTTSDQCPPGYLCHMGYIDIPALK